jgi:hypothetical protein
MWSRRSRPAAIVARPAPWMSHGAAPARARPPRASRRAAPNATLHPPRTRNPAIMIHGSLASGAASPLIWIPAAGCPVWRSELAIHAPVKAAGPAIPAAAPARVTLPLIGHLPAWLGHNCPRAALWGLQWSTGAAQV